MLVNIEIEGRKTFYSYYDLNPCHFEKFPEKKIFYILYIHRIFDISFYPNQITFQYNLR